MKGTDKQFLDKFKSTNYSWLSPAAQQYLTDDSKMTISVKELQRILQIADRAIKVIGG